MQLKKTVFLLDTGKAKEVGSICVDYNVFEQHQAGY